MGPMELFWGRSRRRAWRLGRKSPVVTLGVVLALVITVAILAEAHTPPVVESHSQKHKNKKHDDDLIDDEVTVDEGVAMKLDDYEIEYKTPSTLEPVHFYETFDDVNQSRKRWIPSQAQKEDSDNVFKYDGQWDFDLPERRIFPNDRALVLRSKAKHAAISAKLDRKFEFNTKPLYVQYEVTFQNGMDCGGAYIKLLSDSKDLDLKEFYDKTPYTIMFGPDKCGSDIKLHFIFRHKHPLNGSFEEKHAKRPSNRVEDAFNDKKPHLYRLVLKPDNRFEVFVDGLLINQGDLLEDVEPPVNPPIEVEDPEDVKPFDWDERERVPDENAVKPADWDDDAPPKIPDPNANIPDGWLEDEPEMIPDPEAKVPEDWDESMDGDWEAPLIPNPKCEEAVGCGPWQAPLVENQNFKGKWQAPTVVNPNYKGKWTRRMIPNPDYFEDKEPFKMTPIGAVGLEIWTMTDNVLFDNFIVTDMESVINDFTEATYNLKIRALERDSRGVIERIINYSNSHPWLYAVYTIVIGLPVVLIIAFCCGGSSQDKKYDPVPPPEDDEDEEEDDSTPSAPQRKEPLRKSKTSSPSSENDNPKKTAPVQEQRKQSATAAPAALSKDDLEQPEEDEEVVDTTSRKAPEVEDEEVEDDEGWVQTENPNSKAADESVTKTQASSNDSKGLPAGNDDEEEEEEEEEDEEEVSEEAQVRSGNANQDDDEEEEVENGEQGNSDEDEEEEEQKAPEPVDELIPEKTNDHRENSNLKKRRTRRD